MCQWRRDAARHVCAGGGHWRSIEKSVQIRSICVICVHNICGQRSKKTVALCGKVVICGQKGIFALKGSNSPPYNSGSTGNKI